MIIWNDLNDLAAQSLTGNQDSYQEFLKQISQILRPKISRSIPTPYIEDVLQEVLLGVHKSLHTLKMEKGCKSWVYAIAQYKINDFLRDHYKRVNIEDWVEEKEDTQGLTKVELRNYIEKLTTPLNEFEKYVLLELKYHGSSVAEVAEKTGKTTQNIKVICFRSIKKLRNKITKDEFHGH